MKRAARLLVVGGPGGLAGLLLSCTNQLPPPGEVIVEVSTDMALPKDIDTVRVQISSNGRSYNDQAYAVGPDGLHVPATIGILSGSDPTATALVRVTAIRQGKAIILREATTEVPSDRVALMRMPLHFLCEGSALDTPEAGNPADPTVDAITEATCPKGQTCVEGACLTSTVNVAALPTYTPEQVYGGGNASGTGGTCFDTASCFAGAQTASPKACAIDLPSGVNPADLNIAIQTTDGQGICDGAAGQGPCFAPIDEDPAEGWQIQGGRIQLPAGLCDALATGSTDRLVLSTGCPSKTPDIPTCGPWSSATAREESAEGGTVAGDASATPDSGDDASPAEDAGSADAECTESTLCGAHQTCQVNAGVVSCTCAADPTCSAEGSACASPTTLVTCAKDPQGCFYASASSTCTDGACTGGTCCQNACTAATARCSPASSVETQSCGVASNGCTAWTDASTCTSGLVCEGNAGSACVDPTWAEWPMSNPQIDVTSGAPNLESYTDNGDGTVTDHVTGLIWQQAAQQANCAGVDFAGRSDWRLPSVVELLSLVDPGAINPSINSTYFPNTPPNYFSSSTAYATTAGENWDVSFYDGNTYNSPSAPFYFRCVR